jgi:flagellar basal-body rod protein FlgB
VQNTPIIGLLRETLTYLTQRQKVLAENVANANTPGYMARDIQQSAFDQALARRAQGAAAPASMAVTSAGHIASPMTASSLAVDAQDAPDSEITIDGNAVVLEEQMTKVVDTQMRYETVVGLYEKSLGLIRLAARPPMR